MDDRKIKDTEARKELIAWVIDNEIIDLAELGIEDAEAAPEEVIRSANVEIMRRLKKAVAEGRLDYVPAHFLSPEDWVSIEMPLAIPAVMTDPRATARQRIRTANDLGEQIGRCVIESFGSGKRYPRRSVTYWETDMVLNRLGAEIAESALAKPAAFTLDKVDIPHKKAFREAFGDTVTITELAGLDVTTLRAGLGIDDADARALKSEMIGRARATLAAASATDADDEH